MIVALLALLIWFIAGGIANVLSPGNEPVSDTPATTTTVAATTTAKPTYPTIAVSAPLTTPRVVLYDVTHDTVLYSKDADERCYPASLTKR